MTASIRASPIRFKDFRMSQPKMSTFSPARIPFSFPLLFSSNVSERTKFRSIELFPVSSPFFSRPIRPIHEYTMEHLRKRATRCPSMKPTLAKRINSRRPHWNRQTLIPSIRQGHRPRSKSPVEEKRERWRRIASPKSPESVRRGPRSQPARTRTRTEERFEEGQREQRPCEDPVERPSGDPVDDPEEDSPIYRRNRDPDRSVGRDRETTTGVPNTRVNTSRQTRCVPAGVR
nr:uncharacterized protein LOC117218502 isoform X4 [Megalopta genalis]